MVLPSLRQPTFPAAPRHCQVRTWCFLLLHTFPVLAPGSLLLPDSSNKRPQVETHWQWRARSDSQVHLQSSVWLQPQSKDRSWEWRMRDALGKWRFSYKCRWIDAVQSPSRLIPVPQTPVFVTAHHSSHACADWFLPSFHSVVRGQLRQPLQALMSWSWFLPRLPLTESFPALEQVQPADVTPPWGALDQWGTGAYGCTSLLFIPQHPAGLSVRHP